MKNWFRSSEAPAEAGAQSSSVTRRTLLVRSAALVAVAAPAGALLTHSRQQTAHAAARPVAAPANASAPKGLGPIASNKAAFTEIQQDENAHVTYLQQALKSAARPKPTFKGLEMGDITAFANQASAFENTGVGAYLLGAGAISDKAILAAAASVLTIEARHSGFLGALLGQALSPNGAFDKPLTQDAIVSAVAPFVANLNGGPDPAGKLGSDTDILNFALLLEYLEAEFYNINVPKFFGGVVPGNG